MYKRYIVSPIPLCIIFIMSGTCYSQITENTCSNNDSLQWASTSAGCLHLHTYKSDAITDKPNLIIVIHGDAPFNKPDYHYQMAKDIAVQNSNLVAVGLLRPGYTDPDGNTSDGKKGLTTGDNYTVEVINAITEAIEKLKKLYHPTQTIIVGHSGGAALSADIIGLKHNLINKAVIVSCPCNVPLWRNYMSKQQPDYSAWKDSVNSVSPLDVAGTVTKGTEVIIISGTKDSIAPTELSVSYFNKLKRYGVKSKLILIPNEGHEILLNELVFAALKTLLSP